MTWQLGLSFHFLPIVWSMGMKCVRCIWPRTGWQQEPQLHNRFLVNPFMYPFWHAALCAALPFPRQAKRAV